MKRWLAPVAVGMVLLYTALAIGAAGCLFMQTEEPHHAHHSPSHAHSALCTWVCQANPTETIHAAIPIVAGVLLVAMQPLVNTEPPTFLICTISRSRAPPV